MVLFYTENINNNQAEFDAGESKHIQQALRKSQGDSMHFVDGNGKFYEGRIIVNNKKSVIAEILTVKNEAERSFKIHIAIAPTKNMDRIEWFVEKSIELGIDEISFIKTKHSERKVIKLDRIKRIAVAAMKQSLKATMPVINELKNFEEWIESQKNGGFIACLNENTVPLFGVLNPKEDVIICIGPEGGFRDSEVKNAIQHNFKPVSLGQYRLRTETAGIYSVAQIHLKND